MKVWVFEIEITTEDEVTAQEMVEAWEKISDDASMRVAIEIRGATQVQVGNLMLTQSNPRTATSP